MAPLLPRYQPDDSGARVAKAVQADGETHVGPGSSGGEWRQLRGIPAIGRGVGGEVFGSRPDRAILRLDIRP